MRECDGGPNTRPRLPRLATAAPEGQPGLPIAVRSNLQCTTNKEVPPHPPHPVGHSVSQPARRPVIPAFPEHKAELSGKAIVLWYMVDG